MSTVVDSLPRWDVSTVFPGLDSPEFTAASSAHAQSIDKLGTLFDQMQIGYAEEIEVDNDLVERYETAVRSLGDVVEESVTLRGYIYSFVSTDSRDDLAAARLSDMQNRMVAFSVLTTRFKHWIGALDVEELITQSTVAQEHAFQLRQTKIRAEHLMSPIEEELAAIMTVSGGSAWARLHGTLSSQIVVEFQEQENGPVETLPMSAVRNLAYHKDRSVRQRAYEAELDAWQKNAVPFAAAMNGVKGEVSSLAERRGWTSGLEEALFNHGIDQQTLDAMIDAATDFFPDFRRYLNAKAQMLGLEKLTWYDLFAPVVEGGKEWSYDEATNFILTQFGAYSPRMKELAQRAFDEDWIDAGPRPGKRDGAFCMRLRAEESRILSNFKPSYSGLNTLAHELGHAYHGYVLADRQPLLRQYPMTLAETASIFCETIVRKAALDEVDEQEQINILESSLMGACQVVVDITSRFLFEKSVFEGRSERELSIKELNEYMLDAQRKTYGDGLDQETLHPYMWAVKGHYYSTGRSYYNFPYMFGLLFGLGLYARYMEDADKFRQGYDDLLNSTGVESAADLASRFDIDIRSKAFPAGHGPAGSTSHCDRLIIGRGQDIMIYPVPYQLNYIETNGTKLI